jgi:probable phosphoglycerate mutase
MQAIYTSPLERAIETAEILGELRVIRPVIRKDLGELHFGDWEGQTFEELSHDPRWIRFNQSRSLESAPGGEWMLEAQSRMVREIETLQQQHPEETVAVVSHLDPLRALISFCLGMPLDFILRFEICPGSLSVVQYVNGLPCVICINRTTELVV